MIVRFDTTLITAAVLYLAMGPPLGPRLAVAAIGLVLGAVIVPLFRQWSLRRNSVRSRAFPDAAARSAFIADVRQGMAGKLGS